MSLVKILRNESGSTLQILNRELADGASYTVPQHFWFELAEDTNLHSLIISGDVVVNDGSSDLSPSEGEELAFRFQFDSAEKISFDNTSNNFVAETVQDAIEEAQSVAISKPRFTIVTTFNGSIGNNTWLGYSELIPGNQIPIRIPVACTLKEITIGYNNTQLLGIPTGGNLIDGRLQVYKNGLTDPTHIVHTETFTNQADGRIITGLNISLVSNDFIVSRWKDDGDNPSDLVIVYFFQVE